MRGRLARVARDPLFNRYRKAFIAACTGIEVYLEPGGGDVRYDGDSGRNEPVAYPRVGIYTGKGASHSWIWFSHLLERIGLFNVYFIDGSDMSAGGLESVDLLLVGGGDTYEMAGFLGVEGAGAIEDLVTGGGLYYGSCAGAYLVLSMVDRNPFTPFSLVEGDMLNVMKEPPAPRCLEHKYLARYGDRWVFHPVYGEVSLEPRDRWSNFPCFKVSREIIAPLFGGPVMSATHREQTLIEYSGLTDRAAFLWSRPRAEELMLGNDAALIADLGAGTVMVSGPHLEHPLFPEANALVSEVLLRHCACKLETGVVHSRSAATPEGERVTGERESLLLEIKRQVSNARIAAFGLEKMPVTWRIGLKVWEPEKIRMFLEQAWDRIPYLERFQGRIPAKELESLADGYREVTCMVRSLKMRVESSEESVSEASSLIDTLKELTAGYLSLYFRLRLEEYVC